MKMDFCVLYIIKFGSINFGIVINNMFIFFNSIYLLKSMMPHTPQRKELNSLGPGYTSKRLVAAIYPWTQLKVVHTYFTSKTYQR